MSAQRKAEPLFGRPIGPWRLWFAWYPVSSYDGETLWLGWIERRRIQKHDYLEGGSLFWWQYARPGECAGDRV